ncbi:WxL domain-containing protein [Lactobacillus sp. CC-MHH1034]|uniref:WxL domain-containing protein n=1 Tax=Agrilactobacillus fermenti TaxID=2586909 RepID=UPI001E54B6A6|nr:WxL domain-containing protein [Agrilactobacillus fermenti]MCD2256529.1 WxL domain-containing protein [Agrilactobacillus fermenti]
MTKRYLLIGAGLLLSGAIFGTKSSVAASEVMGTMASSGSVSFTSLPDPFRVTEVPDMYFGSIDVNYNKATTKAAVASGGNMQTTQRISVHDVREGLIKGWHLQAQLSDFTSTAGSTIKGAVIRLSDPKTQVNGADTERISLSGKSEINRDLNTVLVGETRQLGEHTAEFDYEDMRLVVPPSPTNATEGYRENERYEAVITWNLFAGPEPSASEE